MYKLSEIPAPAIAGVIREKSERAAIAEAMNCRLAGATMLDLHLSCLTDSSEEALGRIIGACKLPLLALNYNKTYEWADLGLNEEERTESLMRAVRAGAEGVDIQGYTFDAKSKDKFFGEDKYSFTKGAPKEVVTDSAVIDKQCDYIERVHSLGAEVLLSCHPGIVMNADSLVDLALFMEKRNPDIIKIVSRAETEDDVSESIRAMLLLKKEVKTPVSYHANGPMGALTRIINPLLGGKIAFCVEHYNEGSTFEQIDLRAARAMLDNLGKIV